ncbi:MAG: isoprenyl transferase [Deltaproteobacteria bacterium]
MTERTNVPVHVAVIMDGNGRWAAKRGLPRFAGHFRGAQRVKEIVKAARESGVKVLTLYTFSNENWKRPAKEVETLMGYIHDFLTQEEPGMHKEKIRLRVIGGRSRLPEKVLSTIESIERSTAGHDVITLVLAIDYGSRQEMVEACRAAARECARGKLSPEDIDEKLFSSYLYTAGLPDPDLLIRTSGEQRLSNYLLWQLSYAEFYFTPKLWPDFGAADLKKALGEYARRQRRYGA